VKPVDKMTKYPTQERLTMVGLENFIDWSVLELECAGESHKFLDKCFPENSCRLIVVQKLQTENEFEVLYWLAPKASQNEIDFFSNMDVCIQATISRPVCSPKPLDNKSTTPVPSRIITDSAKLLEEYRTLME